MSKFSICPVRPKQEKTLLSTASAIRYPLLRGKWRYASSEREMEICKQPKGKWRFASSIAFDYHIPVTQLKGV